MYEKETKCIIGDGESGYEQSISPPIFQTSTFGGGGEYSYTRLSNPTRTMLERELAELEGGRHAFAFSSGLAAVNCIFSLLKSGDRVLISDDLYGGTYRMAMQIFTNFGIKFDFLDLSNPEIVEAELKIGAKMVFAESPTNPMMKIIPLRVLSALCRKYGALFAVDNTFLTPCFQTPLSLGADIALHSATKFLSGHHDTVAGAVVVNDESLKSRLTLISMTLGNALSPFDSWLVLRGMRTLFLRMEKHQNNAFAVAEFLKSHPLIDRVIYPGLPEHKGHELLKTQASGFGGVVSFTVRDANIAKRLIKGGNLIKFAESLGGFKSLITYPLTQTHASIPTEMRERIGITDRLLRLSVGLENDSDIVEDLCYMLAIS